MPRTAHLSLPVALLACLALAGCGGDGPLRPAPLEPSPERTIRAYAADDRAPGRTALTLVPADAEVVTITDFDAVRALLGVPDLTSDGLVSDRRDFWEQAPRRSVLLTDGLLTDDASRLLLDHGFTQDDVDWEARFTTPDGPGWVLGFRPDLDMARVRGAVDAGVPALAGAAVDADRHLAAVGTVADGEPSWGERPGIADLSDREPTEAAYYRAGCVPAPDVLGPEASQADVDALVAQVDPDDLDPLETFSLSFGDDLATARLGPDRHDAFARLAVTGAVPAWTEVFSRAAADPGSGRQGWTYTRPAKVAELVLTDVLPFAMCDDVTPIPEPTGL